jgi:type IX secretion system substrate protein
MKKYLLLLFFLFSFLHGSFAGCGGPHLTSDRGGSCPGPDSYSASYFDRIDTVYVSIETTDTVHFYLQQQADCMPFNIVTWYKDGVPVHSVNAQNHCTYSGVGPGTYSCTVNGFKFTIVFLAPATVETNSKQYSGINIYPNPSTDGMITIDPGQAKDYSVKILNSSGRIIQAVRKQEGLLIIDLSDTPKRLYILVFTTGSLSETKKIAYN